MPCLVKVPKKKNTRQIFISDTRLRARLLLTKRFLKPMMIAGPLFLMYACSGFSLIGFYLVTVLEQADVSLPPLQVDYHQHHHYHIIITINALSGLFGTRHLASFALHPFFYTSSQVMTNTQNRTWSNTNTKPNVIPPHTTWPITNT